MSDRPPPEAGSRTSWAARVLVLPLAVVGLGVVAPPLPASGAGPAGLAVVATADRTKVTRPGEKVGDTFVVRNRGDAALLDLLVSTTTPGTSAPVCAPVPLGGSLAAGATTTCRAGRTVTLADLRLDSITDTATVRARTASGTRVSATGSVTVTPAAPPPHVTDQQGSVVRYGTPFVFRGSSSATPAERGGPAIDQARTVFVDNGSVYYSGKGATSSEGFWRIRPDGTVELDPKGAEPDATAGSVAYRVYDVLGHSSTANLTATVRAQPKDVGAGASTPQNQPVTIDVLGPEDPGQNVDGTRAAFVPGSVRLRPIDADKHRGYATLSPDGKRLTVPYEGEYVVRSDDRVTFDPVPAFSGPAATPDFTVDTTSGNPLTGRFGVDVVAVAPQAKDETVATPYGRPVTLAAASGASAGNPTAPIVPAATVLLAPGATAGGRTYVVGAGSWQVQASGAVTFTPRVGYVGTTTTTYAAVDMNGTRAGHELTVTVRRGAATVPLTASTPSETSVTLDPLARSTPGQRLDGSIAVLDATSVTFPAAGQPAGAVTTAAGRTLTVAGQGTWTADAGSGRVGFRPDAAFAGAAAPVTYRVVDDAGNVATGRLVVVVTSDVPAATDDLVATPLATRVRLPAGTDDRPGAVPLLLARTVFAVGGQPAGSTRSADGRTLVVNGQGTWTLAADGSAAFAPSLAYVGTTAPVAYQVVDTRGATARAALRVLVQPGPSASPDSAVLVAPDNYVTLHALEDDVPGRNADGTLGTLDPTSLRFSGDDLPKGWTLTDDGSHASNGAGLYGFIDQLNGWVGFTRDRGSKGLAGPIRYSVRDTVRDATGAVVHHTVTGTAQVDFAGVTGHATDDQATTTDQSFVRLAGMTNDVPPGPKLAWSRTEVTFPTDQLDHLPPGTKIDNPAGHGSVMTVPEEGTWASHDGDGTVTFAPTATFLGKTTPVTYEVRDGDLAVARAALRVTVVPGARAAPDAVSTAQNVTVRADVSANDSTGPAVDGKRVEWDPDAVSLSDVGLPAGSHLSADGRRLWVPGQGTYAVQALSSIVSFDPVPGFTGDTIPVRVGVRALAQPGNQYLVDLSAPLRVRVTRVLPVARADSAATTSARPVVVPVLANDRAGDGRVPLAGGSVRLRLAPGLPSGTTLSGDAKTLTVPGHGVFLVSGDGSVTFVPLGGAVGLVPTVGYQVADTNASTTRGTLTVTVS